MGEYAHIARLCPDVISSSFPFQGTPQLPRSGVMGVCLHDSAKLKRGNSAPLPRKKAESEAMHAPSTYVCTSSVSKLFFLPEKAEAACINTFPTHPFLTGELFDNGRD